MKAKKKKKKFLPLILLWLDRSGSVTPPGWSKLAAVPVVLRKQRVIVWLSLFPYIWDAVCRWGPGGCLSCSREPGQNPSLTMPLKLSALDLPLHVNLWLWQVHPVAMMGTWLPVLSLSSRDELIGCQSVPLSGLPCSFTLWSAGTLWK